MNSRDDELMDQPSERTVLPDYTGWVAVAGEGQRFAVMNCLRCGAAVTIDRDHDGPKLHNRWHRDHPQLGVSEE